MTVNEYNKVDNTCFLIEQQSKKLCKENNIDFYNYLGFFMPLLINYIDYKNKIQIVKNCDFENKILTKAILNKANFALKENELELAIQNFNFAKNKLYAWLDKTKTPYFFILNPIYKYGAGIDYNSYFIKRFGYVKYKHTGTQNLDIAFDYAIYKLAL